jgi:hypothetical protein
MAKTSRWGHPYPELGGTADVPADVKALAESVDDMAKDNQGTKAARPVAGFKGRYYFATDEAVLYRDTGTEWKAVNNIAWYPPCSVNAEESRTNTVFGTLPTPDEVKSVAVPANGLLVTFHYSRGKCSVASAGRVAWFIGANQMKIGGEAKEMSLGETTWNRVISSGFGFQPKTGGTETADGTGTILSPDVVTAGTFCMFKAAAGTYNVSVQWRATSGSVTAKERITWVGVIG